MCLSQGCLKMCWFLFDSGMLWHVYMDAWIEWHHLVAYSVLACYGMFTWMLPRPDCTGEVLMDWLIKILGLHGDTASSDSITFH